MKDKTIKSLLGRVPPAPERRHDCPYDDVLAAFVDGGLSEPDHQHLTAHFADCDYCLSRLGILGRARDSEEPVPVPGHLEAQARELVKGRETPPRPGRMAPTWAAAAMVVLAAGLMVINTDSRWWSLEPSITAATATVRSYSDTRLIKPLTSGPALLWPRDGIVLESADREFSWTEVADSLYYDLRIVRDDGDLVWQERVSGTRWSLPDGLSLQDGTEYFVRVDALMGNTRAVSSDYVLFKYRGRR